MGTKLTKKYYFHHRVTEDTENDLGRPGALRINPLCSFSKRASMLIPNDLSVCAKTHIPKIVNTKLTTQQKKRGREKRRSEDKAVIS
jgi:hypothetical protein